GRTGVAFALPHIQEKNCTAYLPSHSAEAELQAKRKGELNQALSTNGTKQPAVDSVMLQLCIQARRAQFEATSNKCRETFPKKLQNGCRVEGSGSAWMRSTSSVPSALMPRPRSSSGAPTLCRSGVG